MELVVMITVAIVVYLVMKYVTDKYFPKEERPLREEAREVKEEIVPEKITEVTRDPGNTLLKVLQEEDVAKISEHFQKLDDVTDVIQAAGIKTVNLIFGIDYTASNYKQGLRTYGGRSLHDVTSDTPNPYTRVIETLGKTLEPLSQNGHIPAFGFGDSSTRDVSVFPLKIGDECHGFEEVLEAYNKTTPTLRLSGPTNFAPLIYQAISIVERSKSYHILVIVADGQVTREIATREAIVEASNHALSIIMIGVGDGPWDDMDMYDDQLPERRFDNFHFIDFHKVTDKYENAEAAFAIQALMEIPDQYKSMRHLGYLL